jgi:L-iditol 2-dehydrogenase
VKAAVYYNNHDVRVEEVARPHIGRGELLVKVIASGICGSDVMEWYRIKKAPRILGHEIAGEVVEAGKGVSNFKPGDRVFVTHHVPCNECEHCRSGYHTACDTLHSTNFDPGGFAQYLRVPEINVRFGTIKLPDEVSFDQGTFVEPLGCVIRSQRFAGVESSDSVLVIGSGISGLLHIRLAKARGVANVFATDINPYRLDFARRSGADIVIDAREDVAAVVKNANGGKLADKVIVCTTALQAFEQAFASIERTGTLLLFAPTDPDVTIPLPMFHLYFKLVNIVFSYAAVGEDLIEAMELLKSKRVTVDDMITHRFGLTDTQKGFDLVARAEESMKIIIEPHLK